MFFRIQGTKSFESSKLPVPRKIIGSQHKNEKQDNIHQIKNDHIHHIRRYGALMSVIKHFTLKDWFETVPETFTLIKNTKSDHYQAKYQFDSRLRSIGFGVKPGSFEVIMELSGILPVFLSINFVNISRVHDILDQEIVKLFNPLPCPHISG